MQSKFNVNMYEALIKSQTILKFRKTNLVGAILVISLCEKYEVWRVSVCMG